MKGCLTETTTCVVAKPLVCIKLSLYSLQPFQKSKSLIPGLAAAQSQNVVHMLYNKNLYVVHVVHANVVHVVQK